MASLVVNNYYAMKRYLLLILLFPILAHAQSWQKTGNALQYKVRAPLDTVWAFNLGTPTNNLLSFTPHGGGGGSGTVTSVTGVNTNGFTWSIATPTTHPALTLTLQNATTSQAGQLTAADWNTFNGKLSPTGSAAGLTGLLSSQVTTALGFTPENVANKATSFGVLNNMLYPTTQAVQNLFNTIGSTIYTGNGTIPGNVNRTITLANGTSTQFNVQDSNGNGFSLVSNNGLSQSQMTSSDAAYNHFYLLGGNANANTGIVIQALNVSTNKNTKITFNDATPVTILDENTSIGGIFAADYSTNQRIHPRSVASVGTVKLIADSVKATISAGGITALTGDVTASGSGSVAATLVATTNSTLTTLSVLSLPYSQLTGTPSLSSYLTAIGVTTANGVSGTSSGGTTPNLTIALGDITPTSISTTIKPATIYQTATGTAGTDSIMVKHSGGVVNAIAGNYYQVAGSYALQSTTISAGTGLSGGGSLAANRTLSADTTVLQTVLNFKPLGSTYWLSKTASTLPSNFTASSLASFGSSPTLNTAVLTGLPTGTGVSNSATASTLAARDANSNLYANAFHPGFTTTVSSGTPIVLTVASAQVQEITGTTAQTITLPVASTLTTGWTIIITSASSAAITIQSSGGNTVATIQNGNTATLWCVLASGTGLASWDRTVGVGSLSGTSGGGVLSTGATMNTLTLTGTTTTAAITAGASSITGGTVNAVKAGAGTTPNAGIALTNSTAATVGTQNQYGLDQTWTYSAYNTTSGSANQQQFAIEPRGITGATTGGNIFFKYQNNGGGFTDAYSFGSNGTLSLLTVGGELKIAEGSGGFVGQTTLVSGTKAITVTGVTTSSRVFVSLVSQGGTVTTTTAYAGVATANTITITALTNAGVTDTTDTSVLNYQIIN